MASNKIRIAQGLGFWALGEFMHRQASGTWMRNFGFAGSYAGVTYNILAFCYEKTGIEILQKYAKEAAAGTAFAGCSAVELLQALETPLTKMYPQLMGSVYDPKDFIAYGAGIASAYTLDVILERYKGSKS